ncbi:MAG: aquaporin [Chloroflexota bacterium]|jgi:aquaporin Z|nr:aquaporin [Chloroflexota bacterium]
MLSGWTDRRAVLPIVAELAGTFLFFFVGIGSVASLDRLGGLATLASGGIDPAAGLLVVALAHGVVLAVLVSALGVISGAHFNPAVTFAFWLSGNMAWRRASAYVIAQLIGGLLAALAVRYVLPAALSPTLGTPALGSGVDAVGGIIVETVLTVILLTAVFGTAVDARGPKLGGLAIGLAVGADILMGGPLTGAAMNPARWFGPAAVTEMWDNWYVWIVGPLLGAAIVALAYRYLFAPVVEPVVELVEA